MASICINPRNQNLEELFSKELLERKVKMKIRPVSDHVLVQRLETETQTLGGIILPDSAKEKPQRGRILRAGKGRMLDDGTIRKMQVKEGDMVLFTSYAGTEVKIDGKEYLIMDESDIMVVLEE